MIRRIIKYIFRPKLSGPRVRVRLCVFNPSGHRAASVWLGKRG